MKRSVILMGGKTYVLSLPSQWIKKYRIQKGEELDIEEKDNSIIVRTERHPAGKELEVDFSVLQQMLSRGVGAIYKAGYSRAKIAFHGKEQLQKIEESLQRTLVGFEITKQAENYVLIESLTEVMVQEFPNSLKRIFYSLELMNQDLVQALSSKDKALLKKVIDKDGQINRLADFCRRVINTGETQLLDKPHSLYYIVEQLERIGDLYKKIATLVLEQKMAVSKESLSLLEEINVLLVSYRTLFYGFTLGGFETFGKDFYALRTKIEQLYSTSKPELFPLLLHQGFLAETIFDMNGALLTRNV